MKSKEILSSHDYPILLFYSSCMSHFISKWLPKEITFILIFEENEAFSLKILYICIASSVKNLTLMANIGNFLGVCSYVYSDIVHHINISEGIKQKLSGSFFFNPFKIFIYLFILVALGLCCCAQAFSSCSEQGLLFVWCAGFLLLWLLLLQSAGSRRAGFSSCSTWAQ